MRIPAPRVSLGRTSKAAGPEAVFSIRLARRLKPPRRLKFVVTLFLILNGVMLRPPRVEAQFDMVIFEKRPPQAQSREELNAVLDIVQSTDPKKIVSVCADFRTRFPTSEFLGHVYRMEMHAYGTLDEARRMIEAGQKALELNSHDVDALLTLANTVPNGVNNLSAESTALLDKAEGYARQALQEIDGLKATRGVPLDKWRKLTGRMRSSAQEALGFIAFKRGRYAESVTLPADGPYMIDVQQRKDTTWRKAQIGYVQPYPAEYLPVRDGERLLAQISAATGGQTLAGALGRAVGARQPVNEATPLAIWLLLGAALLWPIEIAARRGWLRWG